MSTSINSDASHEALISTVLSLQNAQMEMMQVLLNIQKEVKKIAEKGDTVESIVKEIHDKKVEVDCVSVDSRSTATLDINLKDGDIDICAETKKIPNDVKKEKVKLSEKVEPEPENELKLDKENEGSESKKGLDAFFSFFQGDQDSLNSSKQGSKNFDNFENPAPLPSNHGGMRKKKVLDSVTSFNMQGGDFLKMNMSVFGDDMALISEEMEHKFSFDDFVLLSANKQNPFSCGFNRNGETDLSPYYLKKGVICDRFPKHVTNPLSEEVLFSLCFPDGLSFRIIPKCAIEGAERIGLCGRKGDEYQIHSFQDEKGKISLGISITTKELVSLPNMEEIKEQHDKQLVASKIVAILKNYRRNIFSGFFGKNNRRQRGNPNKKSKESAAESYQEMNKKISEGYVCIIEKCYILIGVEKNDLSLLFSALQRFIDVDKHGLHTENALDKMRRHVLVEEIQTKVFSDKTFLSKPKPGASNQFVLREIEMKDPLSTIQYTLPLPKLTNEWGVARLILRIKLPNLITLLKLLLLERSVFVIGDNPEEVSCCTFALVDLLKPFTWSSVFIPSLSEEMMDFISSPVPFIAAAARQKRFLPALEERCKGEQLTLVNLNEGKITWTEEEAVQKKFLPYCRSIRNCWFSAHELTSYQERIEYLAKDPNSPIASFKSFFTDTRTTRPEYFVTESIGRAIEKYLQNLGGYLTKYSHGWMAFCKKDDVCKERVFEDKRFIGIMNHQYEYRKEFSRTQLVACYYEEKKNKYKSYSTFRNSLDAVFIVDWISYQWPRHVKSKKNAS